MLSSVLSHLFFLVKFYYNLPPSCPFLSPAPYCSVQYWSSTGLWARVTPHGLINPSGCRVNGKHMGSFHSTLQKQLPESHIHNGNASQNSGQKTWQDEPPAVSAVQTLCCLENRGFIWRTFEHFHYVCVCVHLNWPVCEHQVETNVSKMLCRVIFVALIWSNRDRDLFVCVLLPAGVVVEAAGRNSVMALWGSAEGSWSMEGFPVAPPAAAAAAG